MKKPHPTTENLLETVFYTLALLFITIVLIAPAQADDYSDSWGPATGQPFPALSAPDQSGVTQSVETLGGQRGLLLFMNRSTDW